MNVYYNDHDAFCVNWLKNLIAAGHLPAGTVDDRDINDVEPGCTNGCTQAHFFAGIGGWPYALKLAGWPANRQIWTASCPCQPFSQAGKQAGFDDERHLWPVLRGLIAKCHPTTIVGEQVASPLGREWLAGVFADLEALGYAVAGTDLCAAGVSSPHIRQRLYWVAYAADARQLREEKATESDGRRFIEIDGGHGSFRMADASCERIRADGCGENVGSPRRMQESNQERERVRNDIRPDGSINGLGDTDIDGRKTWESTTEATRYGGSVIADGYVCGLGDADRKRESTLGRVQKREEPEPPRMPWDDYFVVACRDPKRGTVYRRISTEPESFPLAPRLPGRVGRLRGYGNTIVPQVAATFVRAVMEIRNVY